MATASKAISLRSLRFVVLLLVGAPCHARGEGPAWIRDLSQGIEIAREQQKDLLILFTGHGWCQPCEIFDAEVFQDEEFVRAAGEDFVFVEFDANFGDTPEEKQREATHREMSKRFLVTGVPTVVLAAPTGAPYALLGYTLGEGPQKTLEQYRRAKAAGAARDSRLQLADSASGAERIGHLHAALEAMTPHLGSIDDHGEDPLIVFYRAEIDEILAHDSDAAGDIPRIYRDRVAARDAWHAARAAYNKVKELRQAKEYKAALEAIAEALPAVSDPARRWALQYERHYALWESGDHAGTLAHAQQMLEQDGLDARQREEVLEWEKWGLVEVGRGDEAVAQIERRLAAADDRKRNAFLYDRAMLLRSLERHSEEVTAWQAARDAAESESFDWLTAHAWLARAQQKVGSHADAIASFETVLATLDRAKAGEVELTWPWEADGGQNIMLETAESCLELADVDKARTLVAAAEAAIPRLKASPHADDRRRAEEIQTGAARVRVTMESQSNDAAKRADR